MQELTDGTKHGNVAISDDDRACIGEEVARVDRQPEGARAEETVEEAARLIRVGRTKACAMAEEWRATGGRLLG